jgi:3-methyladenine DNA glycosylase AlkD
MAGPDDAPHAAHASLVDAVRVALAARADPARAQQQQRYMKSAMPYRGVTAPDVRAAMRELLADPATRPSSAGEWEATIRTLWDEAAFREERYAALAVARHASASAYRAAGVLPLARHLIETGGWWDLVDETATHLVRDEVLARPGTAAPLMRAWATDPELWVRRAAILCQVGAGDRVDLDLLRDVIVPNLERGVTAPASGKQDFFIRKGIGWALRDASYRRPEWVVAFVDAHRAAMAGLTVREALKHVRRAVEMAR